MTARSARPARHRRIQQAPKHAQQTEFYPPAVTDAEAIIFARQIAGF